MHLSIHTLPQRLSVDRVECQYHVKKGGHSHTLLDMPMFLNLLYGEYLIYELNPSDFFECPVIEL